MKILTGNDLGSGDVVWWDGKGWSRDVNDAVDVGEMFTPGPNQAPGSAAVQ